MKRCFLVPLAVLLLALPGHAQSGRGRNKKLYAVPAPKNVVIDGKLDDWDWSGHIESFDQADRRATQSAQLAVMYDDNALYIGAKVKDATPLLNRNSPAANAEKAWMGDCLQFRLVTDRALPFPLLKGNLGKEDEMGKEIGQPLHLMLWYFTDGKEPALQIHRSMAMEPVKTEWPQGVVPRASFQAEYSRDEGGKGYAMEYRIPWKVLNAEKTHPISGDVVSATAQFLWGDASGLNNTAVAYDLMSAPGFPWQSTGQWGKLIFSERGDIPRAWVEPTQKTAPPAPLSFSYDLPADGEVSIALFDRNKRIVRHVVAQQFRKAGKVTEHWDGRDSSGKPLPAGEYSWKGIYHAPITTRYVMSIANSGQPAWKTADNAGGWGGDYGPPTSAAVAGDMVVLGWTGHEAGWGIIGVDLNGKKKWGVGHKNAEFLATDGTRFFAPGEEGGKEVNVYAVANGQPLAFGNGKRALEAPPGGDEKSNKPTGLAFGNNTIYVSFAARDLIGLYESATGNLKTTWKVSKPGRLAALPNGSVIAISGGGVLRVQDGKSTPFSTTNLDAPTGVATGGGKVYIANGGARQNISVFDASGKYLQSIGKRGGRPRLGDYDPTGVLSPAGIAVDSQGKLWVPEAALTMKRLSVWDTKTGKLWNEFFGGASYSPMCWIDPANPREAFFDNTIWDIDLQKGTWKPKSIFYDHKPNSAVDNGQGGFFYPFRVFTGKNKKQYAVSTVFAFGTVLWMREGDTFRPLYYLFRNRPNPAVGKGDPPFVGMEDEAKYPGGHLFLWSDANRDQIAQMSEVTDLTASGKTAPFFDWMDESLNLYGDGMIYKPTKIGADGVPQYDFTGAQRVAAGGGTTWTDPNAKSFYTWRNGADFARFNADGSKAWSYENLKIWQDAINEGEPKPGSLTGATMALGIAGRYSGLLSYFGVADLVRDDGVYVAQLFEPPSKGNNGPNVFYIEFLAAQMLQTPDKKTYIVAGDQDNRVSEVLGLETVKDLPGGTYQHTPELVAQAAKASADSQAGREQPLVLARGGASGLAISNAVGKTLNEKQAFAVQAAYDARNLYFHYVVTSPSPFLNARTDPQTIYKGGNLLDIQIATDNAADPKRSTPAAGDVRLLISRRDDQVWASILRPKVAGFAGKPITLTSPTGQEKFDSIETTNRIELRDYQKTETGFEVTAVVPLDLIGLQTLRPGDEVRLDAGYIFGDALGANASARAYWHNNSFTANVVNDIPNESRLEPQFWGLARVE